MLPLISTFAIFSLEDSTLTVPVLFVILNVPLLGYTYSPLYSDNVSSPSILLSLSDVFSLFSSTVNVYPFFEMVKVPSSFLVTLSIVFGILDCKNSSNVSPFFTK